MGFNAENHLTSVQNTLSAGYRSDGLRSWKQVGSTKTWMVYGGSSPLYEVDDYTSQITTVNTWGPTGLLSRRTLASNSSVFYTFDPQGNTSQRLDANGNVLSSHLFDAFGQMTSVGSGWQSDPYASYGGQAGNYRDNETGLTLMGHRYYDPARGRFLTRDPIGYGGGVNLYGYVGNNAPNSIDPSGLYYEDGWGYVQDVGKVFKGYGKAIAGMAQVFLHPIETASSLMNLTRACGIGGTASTLVHGMWQGMTQWTQTEDPEVFGESFGNFLITLASAAAPYAKVGGACFPEETLVQVSGGASASEMQAEEERECSSSNRVSRGVASASGSSDPMGVGLPTVSIRELRAGMQVASRNPVTGVTEWKSVVRTFQRTVSDLVEIVLSDRATGEEVERLRGTPEHPFFTSSGLVAMGELQPGMEVLTRRGPPLVVKSVKWESHPEGIPVYNFEVEGDHTYFIGKAQGGIWVHNACYVTLYRAVSMEESADILATGGLRAARSMSGKWFAETAEDAAKWGRLFYEWDGKPIDIIKVRFRKSAVDKMMYKERLDGIGPAYYADPELFHAIREINILPYTPLGR